MASLTSTLTVKLIDDVSKPAKTVAQALKQAEQNAKHVAQAMKDTGATDRFVRSLGKMKLGAKDIETVSKAWQDYSKSAGLAAHSSDWTKQQAADVRRWESQTIGALRAVKREQVAFNRSLAAATPRGVHPIAAAMSANALANARLSAGLSAAGLGAVASGAIGGAGLAGAKKTLADLKAERKLAMTIAAQEAASRVSPTAGYLIGGGAALATGAAIGGTAAGGIGAAAYGLKQAVEFDKAMADVRKKVTLDEGATVADVEAMINKNARTFGIARADMAALAAQAGQSGVAYKDLSGFMQTAAKVSSAWDVSAKDAAQSLANVRAQTGWTNEQLAAYADKVNFLGDISPAAEKDINEMWSRSSAGAKAAGVSYDEAMVAMTAMRGAGMETEVASRFFGQFSARLRVASSQTPKIQAAWDKLGMSAKSVTEGMKTKPMETMIAVLDKLKNSVDGVEISKTIFGDQWWDEAQRATQILPELKRLLDALGTGKAKGSLDQSIKIDLATTTAHLERFKALTSEIGDGMMRWALPPLNDQLDRIIKSFETAKATGFLPGPDGKPIDRHKDKTPADFSPENRARWLKGIAERSKTEPLSALEARLRLDRPIPKAPPPATFAASGPGLKIDAGQIDTARAKVLDLKSAAHALDMTVTPKVDTAGIDHASDRFRALQALISAKGQPISLKPAAGIPASRLGNLTAAQAAPPAPAPTLAPRMLREDAKARTIAPPAAQPITVTPKLEPVPPIPPQEMVVTPKVDPFPPFTPQELRVIPKVETGGLDALKNALDGLNTSVTPDVNTSGLDAGKNAADGLRQALDAASVTVSPGVNTGQIDSAVGKVQTLLGLLHQVGAAASGATGKVNALSAAAGAASAKIGTIRAEQNRNFTASAQKGE